MNRRKLLKQTFAATAAVSTFSYIAKAQEACPAMPAIKSEITNNHGHQFVISYEDVIQDKVQIVSVQGKSGHPHTVEITAEVLRALRTQSVVEVETSTNAGHSHVVVIKRDLLT